MKTILVDAIYAFVLEDGTINEAMHKLLDSFPNQKIVLTGASGERFKEFGLDKVPYEVFTLSQNPSKSNPEYYKKMLTHFGLKKDDVVYFEHNEQAVQSARSAGINTHFYDPIKKDLNALKNFLIENT